MERSWVFTSGSNPEPDEFNPQIATLFPCDSF
jgi:hypothetical protein